jgi:hypothetical protein
MYSRNRALTIIQEAIVPDEVKLPNVAVEISHFSSWPILKDSRISNIVDSKTNPGMFPKGLASFFRTIFHKLFFLSSGD